MPAAERCRVQTRQRQRFEWVVGDPLLAALLTIEPRTGVVDRDSHEVLCAVCACMRVVCVCVCVCVRVRVRVCVLARAGGWMGGWVLS